MISCICCSKTVAMEPVRPQLQNNKNISMNEAAQQSFDGNSVQESFAPPPRHPHWLETLEAVRGEDISTREAVFWKELIGQYLYPLEKDEAHEKRIAKELIELRNKTCLAFFLINAFFVALVLTLQQVTVGTSNLSISIPCGIEGFTGEDFEPISMAFMLVFGFLLALQFLAMLVHRMSTFLHISAATNVNDINQNLGKKGVMGGGSASSVSSGTLVDWVKEMQRVKAAEEEEGMEGSQEITIESVGDDEADKTAEREKAKFQRLKSRKTMKKSQRGGTAPKTLDDQFTKVFTQFADETISRRHPSSSGSVYNRGSRRQTHRRAFSDGDDDPVEAISKVAASNDKFRKTLVRKATIMKKGVSFSAERAGVTKRRRANMRMEQESQERPKSTASDHKARYSAQISHLSIRRGSSSIDEESDKQTEDSAL